MPSPDLEDLRVRHVLLQTKADADMKRRSSRGSSLTDAEIRELLRSIWIAEQVREHPGSEIAALARAYNLSDWATRANSPDAMERALSRAGSFFDTMASSREPLLI